MPEIKDYNDKIEYFNPNDKTYTTKKCRARHQITKAKKKSLQLSKNLTIKVK